MGRVAGAGALDQAGVALLWSWKVEDFANLGILLLKESDHYTGPSPVGLFEDEKVGIDIASDVVKVEGENMTTPRFSMGGQGEELCRRFSIVGAPLARF